MPILLGRLRSAIICSVFLPLVVFLIASFWPAGAAAIAAPSAYEYHDGRVAFADSSPARYKPGELLVRWRQEAGELFTANFWQGTQVQGLLDSFHLDGGDTIERLKLKGGASIDKALRAFRSLPGVVYAEPNYLVEAADYAPSDPGYPEEWGLNNSGQDGGTPGCDIGAAAAWDIETGRTNAVTVAIIDTGVDLDHPDLKAKIEPGYNWAGISQTRFYYTESGTQQYTAWRFGDGVGLQKLAQSIKGTGEPLSNVGLLLKAEGTPQQPIHVSLRASLDGPESASYDIQAAEVTGTRGEIYRSLSQSITLTAGTTYYLVFETPNNDASNYYYLYDNRGTPAAGTDKADTYREGMEHNWTGSAWQDYPDDDFYFRTNPNACVHDDNGHGTHVSGIIGAEEGNAEGGVGVSFGARLMPLKVLNCTGGGYYSDIISGIRYAADHGAKVINMSLTGRDSSAALQDAVNYAHARGAVICASAGNNAGEVPRYPAACENVIAVGATGNRDEIASWSNHNAWIDLSAPGASIFATMPTYATSLGDGSNYDYLSGTSMAAAMASGEASLILSKEPRCGAALVEQIMENNAKDLGAAGRDDYFGFGRIDALAALSHIPVFPVVDSLSAASGMVDASLRITGSNFGSTRDGAYVSFGNVPATAYDSWSDASIDCRVPAGVGGQVPVTVTRAGATSNALSFTITPHINSLSANSAAAAKTIAIYGSAFGSSRGDSYVSFSGVQAAAYTAWLDTCITCQVPSGTGQVEVTVVINGVASNSLPFIIESPPPTPPPPPKTWYLAEGCTAGGAETWVLVQNPGEEAVDIDMRFQTDKGEVQGPRESIPARTRRSYNVAAYVVSYDVATIVVPSGGEIICERAEYGNNRQWGHDSIGATSPATTWYLAEGCTAGDFETWVLVQNPGEESVYMAMDFQTDKGEVQGPRESIAPKSRRSYRVNDYIKTYNVSTKVTASGSGVICERAEYGNNRQWGHDSIGATSPATTWYLAEGCTDGDFETWVLVQNPGEEPVDMSMNFQTDKDEVQGPRESIAPRSRRSYRVNDYVKTYNVSTKVTASGSGLICERAEYGNNWQWGHDSIGATAPATTWYLAEGCTAGGFETWVLLQNPGSSGASIDLIYETASGELRGPHLELPPGQRVSVNVGNVVSTLDVSTMVTSDQPIVVERAMYWGNRTGGSDSIGYAP